MAVKTSWSSGDVLTAADLTDTFAAKLDLAPDGSASLVGTAPILTFTDTDTGTDSQISGSGSTGSLLIRADQNNEASSSKIQFWIDGSEKLVIGTDGEISGSGKGLAAWSSYTPTLSGTGWAIGNGTIVGYYSRIGRRVMVRIRVQFGSTSTFGGAAGPSISLPVASAGVGTSVLAGRTADATLGEFWRVLGLIGAGSSTVSPWVDSASGWQAVILNNRPFTYDSSDTIELAGSYEAGS